MPNILWLKVEAGVNQTNDKVIAPRSIDLCKTDTSRERIRDKNLNICLRYLRSIEFTSNENWGEISQSQN